jgi:hypothetical protein
MIGYRRASCSGCIRWRQVGSFEEVFGICFVEAGVAN